MEIIPAPKLANLTTIRLGGSAIAEIRLKSIADCDKLNEKLKDFGGMPQVLGKGSNILAMDGHLPIVLIKTDFGKKIKIIDQDENKFLVSVTSDVLIPQFLNYCIANTLSGLEGLCGIPGSIGGAVAMNAGSFGTDIASALDSITIFHEGEIKTYKCDKLKKGYRYLALPNENINNLNKSSKNYIILEATFRLTSDSKHDIYNRMCHNFLTKKSRQPLNELSAGCAFKNPDFELTAGQLLDKAGFRGKSHGGMAFSAQHANFLINTGNGTSAQAIEFLEDAAGKIKKEFDIILEKEIKIIR